MKDVLSCYVNRLLSSSWSHSLLPCLFLSLWKTSAARLSSCVLCSFDLLLSSWLCPPVSVLSAGVSKREQSSSFLKTLFFFVNRLYLRLYWLCLWLTVALWSFSSSVSTWSSPTSWREWSWWKWRSSKTGLLCCESTAERKAFRRQTFHTHPWRRKRRKENWKYLPRKLERQSLCTNCDRKSSPEKICLI